MKVSWDHYSIYYSQLNGQIKLMFQSTNQIMWETQCVAAKCHKPYMT